MVPNEGSKRRENLLFSSTQYVYAALEVERAYLLELHQSGTGLFADKAAGLRTTDTIWDDSNSDQLEQLSPSAPHRDVDLEILQADKEGYVRGYLITPSTIYGMASGKFVDAGLQNKHSIQMPALVIASLGRGQAGMVGKGLNLWPNVHVDDGRLLFIPFFTFFVIDLNQLPIYTSSSSTRFAQIRTRLGMVAMAITSV